MIGRLYHCIMTIVAIGLCVAAASAQVPDTDPASALPWNGMDGRLFVQDFHSIAAVPGRILVSGSTTASSSDSTYTLSLPFSLTFLDSTYPAGHNVKVGIGGFLSFSAETSFGFAPYMLEPSTKFCRMIFPLWGDFRTTGRTGEGIYHRLSIDPVTHDTTWTIEWQIETTAPPNDRGAFQLQIIKHPAPPTGGAPWIGYHFLYDGGSLLSVTGLPGPFGAQIGIKNLGQAIGPPAMPAGSGVDNGNYLLVAPQSVPTPKPVITRLRTRTHGAPYTPDWYAPWEPSTSSYFHFVFPDSSCKLKPIEMDNEVVMTDPVTSVHFSPGTPATRNVTFHNVGIFRMDQVPVAVLLYHDQTLIDSTIATIDSLPPGAWDTISYSIPALAAGEYRIVAVSRAIQDDYRGNDTLTRRFHVRPATDVMPFDIVAPEPGGGVATGASLQIRARVISIGTEPVTTIRYSYQVRDVAGSLVASNADSTTVPPMGPDSIRTIPLGNWTPSQPGWYFITVTASAPDDSIAANDTLASLPSADWRLRGGIEAMPVPVPFHVMLPYDPAADDPSVTPFLPRDGDTIAGGTPVRALFRNLGYFDVTGAKGHVEIRDTLGVVVHGDSSAATTLPRGGAGIWISFSSFAPPATGRYRARAWISHDVVDSNQGNDTATWYFTAIVDTSGPKRALTPAISGTTSIVPNPTRGIAMLRPSRTLDVGARVTVTDLLGTPLLRVEGEELRARVIPLDLRAAAAGLYLVRIEEAGRAPELVPVLVER